MKPVGETSENTKEELVARRSHIAAIGHVPHANLSKTAQFQFKSVRLTATLEKKVHDCDGCHAVFNGASEVH